MENIYAIDWDGTQEQPGYEWHRIRLARRLDGEMLGGSIYVMGPGQKSFPYHYHHANEEMLIVLEGNVVVRTPEGEEDAGPGDSLIFRKGPSGAHQVINRSDEEARILMMSTMVEPEIAEYPDSGHIGVFAGAPPGAGSRFELSKFVDGSAEVEYFDS
ncbi:MAG: cupin domain-containing protein [Actinomycetota bacterium]|nr:cupin domain-containing protein [Actinomycetota bacterium]